MDLKERRYQRIFILLPGLCFFYFYVFKCKIMLVWLLAAIQITTHFYLLLTDKQCNPKTGNLCNKMALLIGVLFTIIVLKYKLGVVPLFISLYMIVSHLATIYPWKGTFEYKGIELPLFQKESYIFIYCDLFHEKKLSKLMEEFVEQTEGCIIDAGAYIGDSFLLMARKNLDRTFYMIEPSVVNTKFIEQIKTKNVKVIRKLLSDGKKTYKNKNKDKANAFYEESREGEESIRVDSIIHEKVAIMHYDVEGMELEVVKGSMKLIKRDNPIVIVESLGKHEKKTKEIIKLLTDLGYKAYMVDESCAAFDFFDKTKCRNYILFPRKRNIKD